MSDPMKAAFLEEAYELLGALETSLLALEETPDDAENVGSVFRAMHTIKGSGAMFGFDSIASFTHEVETVFDMVRRGEMSVTKELINLTLSARDWIKTTLDTDGIQPADTAAAGGIVEALKKLVPEGRGLSAEAKKAEAAAPPPAAARETKGEAPAVIYRIRFSPPPDIFRRGDNPVKLLNELRSLGECTVIAHTHDIPPLDEIDPELCYVQWDILLNTNRGIDAIRDVFIFVEDDSKLKIEVVDAGDGEPGDCKKMGDILVERGDLTPEALKKALGKQKRIGELLVEEGLTTQPTSSPRSWSSRRSRSSGRSDRRRRPPPASACRRSGSTRS